MIFDSQTVQMCPHAGKLFPKTDGVSGAFYGTVAPQQIKGVHINPNSSVKAVADKHKLMELLAQKGYAVPKYAGMDSFIDQDLSVSPFAFEDTFGGRDVWSSNPIRIANNAGSTMIHDSDDLFNWLHNLNGMSNSQRHDLRKVGVAQQGNILMPNVVTVVAIPNAAGKKLRKSGDFITDGILSERTHAALEDTACQVLDSLDLDMGGVTFEYNKEEPEQHEIIDVHSRFMPQYAEQLLSYIEMLQHAKKR